MNEKEVGKTISKNLKRIMFEAETNQTEVAKKLGVSSSTMSSWMTGSRIPRMDKVDMLCDFFGVLRSDILEDKDHYSSPHQMQREAALLDLFRKLDPVGQDKVTEYIDDLVRSGKYEKKTRGSSRSVG